MQHHDCLALCHAVIDLVRVDGYVTHREGRPPRVARGLRDADEGINWCMCRACMTA